MEEGGFPSPPHPDDRLGFALNRREAGIAPGERRGGCLYRRRDLLANDLLKLAFNLG